MAVYKKIVGIETRLALGQKMALYSCNDRGREAGE